MIKIKDLEIKMNNRIIVSNVSLIFDDKKNYILLGRNGSGKSTLMKEMFKASIIDDKNIEITNHKIFYSDNYSIETFAMFSGFEYLDAYFSNYYGNDWLSKEVINLKAFNVSKLLLQKTIADMSGGERRVLNIIVSIYGDFDTLFVDEIESNLDKDRLKTAIKEINKLWKDRNVIIATHNQQVLNDLNYEKAFIFREKQVKDITKDISKNNSLKHIFKNDKGVIDENFEF